VSVTATDTIAMAGRNEAGFRSGLYSETSGRRPGGDLRVVTPHLELSDGGTISASSTGTGDAGNIVIQAGKLFLSDHSVVTTEAEQGDGGNIQLTAGSLANLRDSEITATVRSGVGRGGNITIDLPFVVLERSHIRANSFGGPGGNLHITADVLLKSSDSPESEVAASSAFEIIGFALPLSGALAPLPQPLMSVAALLPARCAARFKGGRYSSLVLGQRDGLPADPSGVLPSPPAIEERLVADPAVTGEPHRQKPAARFALLAGHEKGLPRLAGGCAN
jgi:hypothetical protein